MYRNLLGHDSIMLLQLLQSIGKWWQMMCKEMLNLMILIRLLLVIIITRTRITSLWWRRFKLVPSENNVRHLFSRRNRFKIWKQWVYILICWKQLLIGRYVSLVCRKLHSICIVLSHCSFWINVSTLFLPGWIVLALNVLFPYLWNIVWIFL